MPLALEAQSAANQAMASHKMNKTTWAICSTAIFFVLAYWDPCFRLLKDGRPLFALFLESLSSDSFESAIIAIWFLPFAAVAIGFGWLCQGLIVIGLSAIRLPTKA